VWWRARPATKGAPCPPPAARTARNGAGRTRAGERARCASSGTTGVHGGQKRTRENTAAGRLRARHACRGWGHRPSDGRRRRRRCRRRCRRARGAPPIAGGAGRRGTLPTAASTRLTIISTSHQTGAHITPPT